jgi:aminopeptidase YwaD
VEHGRSRARHKLARSRRQKTNRLLIVFLVTLLVGACVGVGMNFLVGKPKSTVGKKTDTRGNSSASSGKGGKPSRQAEKPATPQFSVSQAMAHTFALSEQIGSRRAGSIKESSAADYIAQKLAEYGYSAEDQPFTTPDGFASRNISASRQGSREGYTIMIGAHYDSPGDTKGAVNNASGVGVTLELARVLSKVELAPTVRFVFFGANRPGGGDSANRLLGARRYLDMLGSMDRKDVVGIIVVDSVAQGQVLALRTQETGPQRLKDKLATYANGHGTPVVALKSTKDSDNIPFEDAGMAAVWIEWCSADGSLQTDDTYQSVLAGKEETAGKLIESFLYGLGSSDLEELKY